jgi:hypothetical protein
MDADACSQKALPGCTGRLARDEDPRFVRRFFRRCIPTRRRPAPAISFSDAQLSELYPAEPLASMVRRSLGARARHFIRAHRSASWLAHAPSYVAMDRHHPLPNIPTPLSPSRPLSHRPPCPSSRFLRQSSATTRTRSCPAVLPRGRYLAGATSARRRRGPTRACSPVTVTTLWRARSRSIDKRSD